jgi:hypothetical protein
MRPGNLMALYVIKCIACYDLGEVIDRFDHSKRRHCGCRAAGDLTKWGLAERHHAVRGTVKLLGDKNKCRVAG